MWAIRVVTCCTECAEKQIVTSEVRCEGMDAAAQCESVQARRLKDAGIAEGRGRRHCINLNVISFHEEHRYQTHKIDANGKNDSSST